MNKRFTLSVENSPDYTGTSAPETTRFDVYVSGEHDSHTDNEHTGFWGQIDLPEPLPPQFDRMIFGEPELQELKMLSEEAYWYSLGLLDAASIMDDFERNPNCDGCKYRTTYE